MNRADDTIKEVLAMGTAMLKVAGVPEYHLDAQLLLCRLLETDRSYIFTHGETPVAENMILLYGKQLRKRADGMPVAYINNICEFYGLDFYVDMRVLLPRGDTETLVEQVLRQIRGEESVKVLEMGTGSGCIAVTLAHECGAEVTAVDISPGALEVARENAGTNGVSGKIRFIQSDMFEKLPLEEFAGMDIIVSNPPYIETAEVEILDRSVRDYEPWLALDGGADGLRFYRELACRGREYLKPGGGLFMEIGYSQGAAVVDILRANGYENIEIIKDLAGLDRVVYGWRGLNV